MNTNSVPVRTRGPATGLAGRSCLLLSLIIASQSFAAEFSSESGEFYGSWDSTLTYSQTWRVQSRNRDIIATAHGGNGRSPNIDDGNLNYNTGIVSNLFKLTSEVELNYKNMGLFVRGRAFYDSENEDQERARTDLGDPTLQRVGSQVELLAD